MRFREKHRGLPRGVATADDDDLTATELCLHERHRSNAGALNCARFRRQPPIRGARGEMTACAGRALPSISRANASRRTRDVLTCRS
jgi:hypothetical protein